MDDDSRTVENIAERVNKHFGQRLASARRARGITQSGLAKRIGRSRITIANLEAGKQNVQLHQVFALAEAINAQISELIPDITSVSKQLDLASSDGDFLVSLAKSTLQNMFRGSR